jgi:hypothetical protein
VVESHLPTAIVAKANEIEEFHSSTTIGNALRKATVANENGVVVVYFSADTPGVGGFVVSYNIPGQPIDAGFLLPRVEVIP